MIRIAVNGVAGQMGQVVRRHADDRDDVGVVLGISSGATAAVDVPVVPSGGRAAALESHAVDAVVDFSTHEALTALADDCAEAGVALVTGTTGLGADEQDTLDRASESVPVLHAPNFSRGIHALLGALTAALETLPGYDVEVLETHHNRKQDAPSGTAGRILETIAEVREFETVAGREGIQPREADEVGMLVRRAGDVRGEHEVLLADNAEVLTLTHRAEDRAVFAAGALDAAAWLVDREPGRYAFAELFEDG